MADIRILGTGSYVPPKKLTNFDLQEMGLDTSDEWVGQRTGVKERRVAEPDVNTSDLAYEASIKPENSMLVIPPNNEFFNFFNDSAGRGGNRKPQ